MTLQLDRPLVALDLETTGTSVRYDRIVQIGLCPFDDPGGVYARRINPGIPIPPESTVIHGFADEDVKDAPFFSQIARSLLDVLIGKDVVGYNIKKFDVPLLQAEFARCDIQWKPERVIDAQRIFFEQEPRDLASAYRFFTGRELKGAHNAGYDALATVEILRGQLDRYTHLPKTVEELAKIGEPKVERYCDPVGRRFQWRYHRPAFAFGDHEGRLLEDVQWDSELQRYAVWMLKKDFPEDTLALVHAALDGKPLPTNEPAPEPEPLTDDQLQELK